MSIIFLVNFIIFMDIPEPVVAVRSMTLVGTVGFVVAEVVRRMVPIRNFDN